MRDQSVIDAAQAKIAEAGVELEKAQKKYQRVYRAQQKIINAEVAKDEMTLALALEPYIPGTAIDNERAYAFLQELSWEGAWKGSGLMAMGGYWTETTQTQLKVGIPATFSDAQLDTLEQLIRNDALPVIRPGALKGIDPNFADAKAIDVFEDDCAETRSPVLLVFPNDWSEVVNQRYYRPEWRGQSTYFKGTLRDALAYIRGHLSYN